MRSTIYLAAVVAALAAAAHAATEPPTDRAASGWTRYSQPDLTLAGYDKILIEEPTLAYDETSAYRDEKSGVVRAAAAALRAASRERFAVATDAGPGVIRLRAAIVDVRAEERPRRFWQFTPVGFVKGRVDGARGTDVTLYGATIEVELVDALTGRTLATVVDSDDYGSWRHAIARLEWWVRHIVDDPQRWA
jgi:hypothetical protein